MSEVPVEEQQDTEFYTQIVNAYIKEIVLCLSYKVRHLFAFAYEIRKMDKTPEASVTSEIFRDNLKTDALVDIIISNVWNDQKQQMEPNKALQFKIKPFIKNEDLALNITKQRSEISGKLPPQLEISETESASVSFQLVKEGAFNIIVDNQKVSFRKQSKLQMGLADRL